MLTNGKQKGAGPWPAPITHLLGSLSFSFSSNELLHQFVDQFSDQFANHSDGQSF
jgi:hypothetical protein